MYSKILTPILTFFLLFFISCTGEAQNKQKNPQTNISSIEVIQFHSQNRCYTCNKIEEITKETLKSYPKITFKLINVDDKKNKIIAEQFEAAGTSLFIYNPSTKKKKDITSFAFMNASNKTKFIEGLKKEIKNFK